jgi:hypothetical protein
MFNDGRHRCSASGSDCCGGGGASMRRVFVRLRMFDQCQRQLSPRQAKPSLNTKQMRMSPTCPSGTERGSCHAQRPVRRRATAAPLTHVRSETRGRNSGSPQCLAACICEIAEHNALHRHSGASPVTTRQCEARSDAQLAVLHSHRVTRAARCRQQGAADAQAL